MKSKNKIPGTCEMDSSVYGVIRKTVGTMMQCDRPVVSKAST